MDQQGQDRYSTEVVLQGFNSTLTMLDGRAGAGGGGAGVGMQEGGQADYAGGGDGGYDRGGSGGTARGGKSGGGGGFDKELDDEIPF